MPQREIVYSVVDNTRKGLNQLDRNLKRAERSATGLGGSAKRAGVLLGGLAGIAAGAGVAIVGNAIKSAREIDNLANVSQFGAERLQSIGIVAERSGASLEDVADASREMQLRLAEAASLGTGPAVDGLKLLGLSISDLQALRPEDQFALIRDRLSEVEDPALRAFAAEELLGGASERLAETLALSSDEFDRQTQAAAESGAVLSKDAVQGANRAGEAIDRAVDSVKGLATGLVGTLAPAIETGANLLDGLVGWITGTGDASDDTSGDVDSLAESIRRLTNALREEEQYEISVASARAIATERIEEARQAAEGYIAVAQEVIAVNEAAGWGPYREEVDEATEALDRMIAERGGVPTESPAVIEALYAEAAAYRAETAAINAQIASIAALREERGALARLDIGRQTTTRADYQIATTDWSIPSELYDPGRADLDYVAELHREAGYQWDSAVREWVVPAEDETRGAVTRVSRDIVEQATEERRLQLSQLDQLYADGRISELQYDALTQSTDLAGTLNELVEGASRSELSALDQVRRSGVRTGDLTLQGSRDIVQAISALSAAISSGPGGRRRSPVRSSRANVGYDYGSQGRDAFLEEFGLSPTDHAEIARIRNTPEGRRFIGEYDPLPTPASPPPDPRSHGSATGPGPFMPTGRSHGSAGPQNIQLNLDGKQIADFVIETVNDGMASGLISSSNP